MNWNLSINGSPNTLGNQLVAAIYDPSNPSSFPLTPVAYQAITGPFPGTFLVTFTGVNPIVYHFVLWENNTGLPGGTTRNDFSLQPTIQTLQVRTDLYLTVGTSAGLTNGATVYTNGTLSGWTYSLEKVGYGTYQSSIDYSTTDTSFTLLTGETFITGGKWVLHFIPIVSNQPITTTTSKLVSAIALITGITSLSNTDMGKGFAIQGAGASLSVTLPALSTVSDNDSLFFLSSGGIHINARIVAAGSDAFLFKLYSNQVTPQTRIVLGQSEQLTLIKATIGGTPYWLVISASDTIRQVGDIVYNYSKFETNTLFATGNVISRTDYSRLWDFVQTLDSSCIVSAAAWNATTVIDGITYFTNKARFHTGDGSTTFGIPLLYQYGFIRGVDGSTRLPGSFESIQMYAHQHNTNTHGIGRYGSGPSNTQDGFTGVFAGLTDDLVSAASKNDGTLLTAVGSENRPSNTGAYALIRI